MPAQEANLLPVEDDNYRPRLSAALVHPLGAAVNREAKSEVLLLGGAAVSHAEVRAAAQRAGIDCLIEVAGNRRAYLDRVRRGTPSLILVSPEPLPDLTLGEVLEDARKTQPTTPVIVIGGAASETESLRVLRNGVTEYIETSQIKHLPSVLARALMLRESSTAQVRTQIELDRVAAMLRENQKLITVGRLAASIAHEINNPLEAVTNLLYLLGEERGLPESARGYLALAQRELERVGQISRQTLNFSRETTGPVRTHLDDLMEEVLSLYSRRIAEKNLRVERQYDCPEEATVYPGEMRQVLSNLVTNAVEASSMRGRLRVRVRCARNWSDSGVRGIRISVGDNGSGISPEVQRRLGEPFFTTKGQRGTGLGLWVTRSIVHRYGGEIQLRSSTAPERHGTVFSIFLPTNLRPTMVERNAVPTDGGPAAPRPRPLDPTGISRNRPDAGSAGPAQVHESPRRRVNGD